MAWDCSGHETTPPTEPPKAPVTVDLYFSCWNNADMLGFFFAHYDSLVRRYVVFEDGSDDGSRELLAAHPRVEIRKMPSPVEAQSRTLRTLSVSETCWRETSADADWVIMVDVDEHLHHPNLGAYLRQCSDAGITIVPALGYQMIGPRLPLSGRLADTVTMGAPWAQMSKLGAFAPSAIDELRLTPGRHRAAPTGRVRAPERDELLLLHYKYIDFERVAERHRQAATRLNDLDRASGYGHRWRFTRQELQSDWDAFARQAVDISAEDLEPWRTHTAPRWWDGYRSGSAT
jgi:hypothetical protein